MRRLVVTCLALALLLAPAVVSAADEAPPAAGAFAPAGTLAEPRAEHTATLLPDGRVLVIAGNDWTDPGPPTSAEVWDPETATFGHGGAVAGERSGHTATLLLDGRVLVIGGTCCKRNATLVEMWDPVTETFSEAAPLVKGRIQGGHSANLLPDGRVLVVGGHDPRSRILKAAEVWDPATEAFSEAGRIEKVRAGHTATLLPDGRVLVIGGGPRRDNRTLASAEVWDPQRASFARAGSLATARAGHTATLLPDGRVLVIGGMDAVNTVLASAEVWDPSNESFSPAGNLGEPRLGPTATRLPDGRVLVIAGDSGALGSSALPSAEVWDAATASFHQAGSLTEGRGSHTATLLPDGRVLVIGGDADGDVLASAEVWALTADNAASRASAVPASEE
jgi:hypothetical protein